MTHLGWYSLIAALGVLWQPGGALALDCKQVAAQDELQKRVCATPELSALNTQLNAVVAATWPDSAEWVRDNEARWESEVRERLRSDGATKLAQLFTWRLEELKAHHGEGLQEERGPIQTGDETVAYRWVRPEVHGRKLMAYPQLVEQKGRPFIKKLNQELADLARQTNQDSLLCTFHEAVKPQFTNFSLEVEVASVGLFQIATSEQSGGCYCGCAHPETPVVTHRLWDLRTGQELLPFGARIFRVVDGTQSKLTHVLESQYHSDDCPLDGLMSYSTTLSLAKQEMVMDLYFMRVARHCDGPVSIPLKAFVGLVELDEEVAKEAPRLVEAGLLGAADLEALPAVRVLLKRVRK